MRSLIVAAVFLLPALQLSAQEATTPKVSDFITEGDGIFLELDPQIIDGIAALVERAAKERPTQATTEMEAYVKALKEEYELDEAAIAILEAGAEQAVKDSLPSWTNDFALFQNFQLRRTIMLNAVTQSGILQQLNLDYVESAMSRYQAIESALPRSQKSWREALTKALPEAAVKKWDQDLADAQAKRDEAIEEFLKSLKTNVSNNYDSQTESLMEDVIRITSAEGDAKEQIRALTKEVGAKHLDAWMEFCQALLLRTPDSRRPRFSKNLMPGELSRSPEWQAGVMAILSPDQKEKWQDENDRREAEETEKFLVTFNRDQTNRKATLDKQFGKDLDILFKAIEPDESLKRTLLASSEQAISEILEARKEAGLRFFHSLPLPQRQALQKSPQFTFALSDKGFFAEQKDNWSKGIAAKLTPAQSASWEAEKTLQAEEDAKRLADMVDATADSYEMQFQTGLDPKVNDIVSSLKLDEKRAKAFEEAGKTAVKQSIDTWKKRATEWLDGLSDNQRETYTEQGRVPLGYNSEEAADKQPAWTEAFEKILTPEEIKEWKVLQETRSKHRQTAISDLMISLLEEWVGLDEKQWEQLRPICAEGASNLVQQLNEQHFYMNLNQIAQPLKVIDQKKLEKILAASQQERWKWAVTLLESRNRGQTKVEGPDPKTIPPGQDLVAVEDAITELIYQRNREKKDEIMTLLKSEIEIGSRAAKLSPEVVEQLITAAKGATDEVVHQWDNNFASYVRGRIKGANPRTIHQILSGVGNYNNGREKPLETGIWKRSLSLLLDESQTQAWQTATENRETMRRNAIASMVSVYFEGRLGLDEKQGTALRAKLTTAVQTYGPDIESYFTSWSSPWYLQYYSIGLPLMGIPEKELKELLSKDQFTIWEQQFQGNAANYWDSIESRHKQRTKEDEKKEKKS
ncbi:MAG: hypothetical protein KDN20_10895 [Verrucomicrobiae bacterium]|nr:hypothetical protein [Verrucomicrobiae bacterium]